MRAPGEVPQFLFEIRLDDGGAGKIWGPFLAHVLRLGRLAIHIRRHRATAIQFENRQAMEAVFFVVPLGVAGEKFCVGAAHDAHGEFTAREEGLHEGGLLITLNHVVDALAQFAFVFDDGFRVHAHAGPFARGLDEKREFKFRAQRFVALREFLKGSHGQVAVTPDAFGKSFIERDGVGHHARAGVGNLQHLEQGRHLRLARVTAESLSDVEADVRLIFLHGQRETRICHQKFCFMSVTFERGLQMMNRFDVIEIRVGVIRDSRRMRLVVIFDVGQHGDAPITFHLADSHRLGDWFRCFSFLFFGHDSYSLNFAGNFFCENIF